jgi:hypothetical protein
MVGESTSLCRMIQRYAGPPRYCLDRLGRYCLRRWCIELTLCLSPRRHLGYLGLVDPFGHHVKLCTLNISRLCTTHWRSQLWRCRSSGLWTAGRDFDSGDAHDQEESLFRLSPSGMTDATTLNRSRRSDSEIFQDSIMDTSRG